MALVKHSRRFTPDLGLWHDRRSVGRRRAAVGQRTIDERHRGAEYSDRPMLCDPVNGTVGWPNGVDLDPLVLHGDFEPATSRAERQVG